MSVQIMHPAESKSGNGRGNESGTDLETLLMLGGVALVVFGTGLILSNPNVRKYLGQMGFANLASTTLPDIEKYFRLRAM
jgi:hypothetical protein